MPKSNSSVPSRGLYANTGNGPSFQVLDIGHPRSMAVVEPDTAFWSIVPKDSLTDVLTNGKLLKTWKDNAKKFAREMQMLRFGLKPSAVYFNPTEKCNLNCTYCYIPQQMRKNGRNMSAKRLLDALGRLRDYFRKTLPKSATPQIIFHGAEPMLNRDAVFAGIEEFSQDFRFGIQTNATLLDDSAVEFLTSRDVSIGISLDAPTQAIADKTRVDWNGNGVYREVLDAMKRLRGYNAWSVICTVSSENMHRLPAMVDFLHKREVPTCLMNVIRCTLSGARKIKPADKDMAKHFIKALDRTHELYRQTGRKLVVANFSNIILAIIAPTSRRLMCDISPCGGGRCFFALTSGGDMFPCSEFIGLKEFKGGNIFKDDISSILKTPAFEKVTGRKVEDISPCNKCAIRHFCGSPCPAEAHEMNGGMEKTGAFCEFYEEQARYAFRLIADDKEEDFLPNGWDRDTKQTFRY